MSFMPCREIIPGVIAASAGAGLQIEKGSAVSSGATVLGEDSLAPFDCLAGPGTTTTTGPVTFTPLASNHNEDSAESLSVLGVADPCTDYQELGSAANQGGLRDPFNPYDFYDVNADEVVTIQDMQIVGMAFGQSTGPNYHPSKDRGALLGPNSWNREGPDGFITIPGDILVVASQFGHTCA
jgi:hypothetical protein